MDSQDVADPNKDVITDLASRRRLRSSLKAEALQSSPALAVLYLDLDGFREFNRRFGFDAGDRMLREVAKLISPMLRPGDIFGRDAADQFIVILPNTSEATAHELGQRLCQAIGAYPFEIPMTMSVGVATQSADECDEETALRRAGQALGEAKLYGRNRVMVYKPDLSQGEPSAR